MLSLNAKKLELGKPAEWWRAVGKRTGRGAMRMSAMRLIAMRKDVRRGWRRGIYVGTLSVGEI